MTTSFTCSTGLGDKLVPLLLPGMFWLLFERLQKELCVLQTVTCGIKAQRGAVPSPVQSAVGEKDVCGGLLGVFDKTEEMVHTFPVHKPTHKVVWAASFLNILTSDLESELSITRWTFSTLSKYILLKSSSRQMCAMQINSHANEQHTLKISSF